MARLTEIIANWKLRRWRKKNGLCPKHGIPMQVHGYFDDEYCPDCYAENHPLYRIEQ